MNSNALVELVGRLEAGEQLEPLISQVHGAVSGSAKCFGGRKILSGSWLGHPLHPALVSTPIGCFTSALIADLLDQPDSARALIGAGLLAALPTVATGLSDWVDTTGAERRVGFVHLAANIAAVSLFAASWVARRRRHQQAGQLLGVAGAAVMTTAGWLGGHLAYGMGVGVDTTAFEGGPTEWTEIPAPGDAPNRRSTAAGVSVAVFEDDGGNVRVLADRCTHRGGPISQGEVNNGCVTCPWHGSRFDLADGHVIGGPATQPQPVYEVRVTSEGTEVRRDEPRSLRRNPVR